MNYTEAKALDLKTSNDADLVAAWHAHASYISYLEADDYGQEWRLAPIVRKEARVVEAEIRKRGLERPTGQYLLSNADRISWKTGEWPHGWLKRSTDKVI